ncbi:MAG: DUF2271 domain-containing protein [Akkermansiaceae bacterium]|nr:DUF2271 domain-containing protein [Akkermansiaceae bacterium]MCP5546365.1 DUF2271 domain-containing protein [Akkermansiaceae bacterium]
MNKPISVHCLTAAGILLGAAGLALAQDDSIRFHHENILGTSLDLEVATADQEEADHVEKAVLAEVERLRRILSTYDPKSEVSRLNQAKNPWHASADLLAVLSAYDKWKARTHGAYTGGIAPLSDLWHKAASSGKEPSQEELDAVVAVLAKSAWTISPSGTVTRKADPGSIDINSLGKGYIVTKAAVAGREAAPNVAGFLVNIGGDIFASGHPISQPAWKIAIADPARTSDNAPGLAEVSLTNAAVSTSAAYERGFDIGGKHHSHILDPRTGRPAEGVASATVITKNNATSNALATSLCILPPDEGLALVKSEPGAECLIVTRDGRQLRSPGFPDASKPVAVEEAQGPGWKVTIDITLVQPARGGGRRGPKRPYLAAWVENDKGERIRTITVWGRKAKYLKSLRAWWKQANEDREWALSVTRATRKPGKHRIEWDGLDDHGKPVPDGTYTIVLEANREHGTYSIERGTVICGKRDSSGSIPKSSEFEESMLTCAPVP